MNAIRNTGLIFLISLGLTLVSVDISQAQNLPPTNPFLASSNYPIGHGGSALQDSLPIVGPDNSTRPFLDSEIDYIHTGPAFFGLSASGAYNDGKRVHWGNGLDRIVKIDHDSYQVLATYPMPDAEHWYDEEQADAAIATFDKSNDGPIAMAKAFREALKLKSLSSVYTLLDNENTYYIANKNGYIDAYGDAETGVRDSEIELKRRFHFPEEMTGFGAGINMTYDGWLILITEHGYVLALKPDFSEHRLSRLQFAEGAENKATRRAGYGWVRNAPAVDDEGGIYIVSQEYMHRIVWTGDSFSTDEADGAWAVAYANGWTHGSGATPSLMGFAGEDELVVITDGEERMNLVLYWRNHIPEDWQGLEGQPRRVAGILPVTMGDQNLEKIQSEQSVVVAGYGALVVNNKPRNIPWYTPDRAASLLISYLGSNPKHQPYGVQKFEWDPDRRELNVAWVNNDVSSPSCVPLVSYPSNTLYLIGARDNQWTLEAMDWDSGESRFHNLIGGQRYNVLFSGTLMDEGGRIHYGTPWGRVRLNPKENSAE